MNKVRQTLIRLNVKESELMPNLMERTRQQSETIAKRARQLSQDRDRTKHKSSSIDYEAIYQLLTIICLGYFALIYIDFFLLFSSIVPVILLFASVGSLGLHLYFKHNYMLISSFVCASLCIVITYLT